MDIDYMDIDYMRIILIVILVVGSVADEFMDNVHIHFGITGNVSYTPTSGGVPIPGYKLEIAFSKYQWIGIRFMTITSTNNYDVLIVQRSQTPSSGNYLCTVNDYFTTSIRQNILISDSVNNQDRQVTSYSTSNDFGLEIYRTKGLTNGEDWEGGQLVDICFFTSNEIFSQSAWTKTYQSCYGYSISPDYVSTFKGRYVTKMNFDSVDTAIYGGIFGPPNQLLFFAMVPKSSLSSSVVMRIGGSLGNGLNYDYYKCNDGDYYGSSVSSAIKDISYHGYEDGSCKIESSSTSTKITYIRDINTGDQFDSSITSSLVICLITTNEYCNSISLTNLYPIMTVSSAIMVSDARLAFLLGLLFIMMLY